MSFADFSQWARQRFQLSSTSTLSFTGSDGEEIIPSGAIASYGDIEVKEVKAAVANDVKKEAAKPAAFKFSDTFINAVPLVLIALLAITGGHPSVAGGSDAIAVVKTNFESALAAAGLTKYKSAFVEAYMGFVVWTVCYLFIRRMANPENVDVYKKYSADAVFGGLAQAGTVMLKALLK
jgi:hypothetical protein